MAKKKLKLNPAGILFLIAIAVLIIALIAVIVVLSKTCGGQKEQTKRSADANLATVSDSPAPTDDSALAPSDLPTDDPASTATDDPASTSTGEPASAETPAGLTPIDTPAAGTATDDPGQVKVNTPQPQDPTATPSTKVYTSPTSKQKKNAKSGYLAKDKVNMRKGPGKNYEIVKKDIAKNTTVTLYELQGEWWFLKCGSSYGYIRKDMLKEGKPAATAKPTATPKTAKDDTTYEGTIKTNSVAALRKSASKDSDCIKEYENGTKCTVYYKTKGKDGNSWYYVSIGKNKGYIRSDLVSTSKKVPTK